jgi:hypothetical protein
LHRMTQPQPIPGLAPPPAGGVVSPLAVMVQWKRIGCGCDRITGSEWDSRIMETELGKHAVKLTLDGIYTPSDFFEEPVSLEREGYTAKLLDGKAEVTLKRTDPLPTTAEQETINQEIEKIFQIRGVVSGQSYTWTGLNLKRHYPDGRRDIWVSAKSALVIVQAKPIDCMLTGKDGTILRDTKAERLARDKAFLDRCLTHAGDTLLNKLIASFNQAVEDKENMFLHLYEIREALGEHFGGEKKAIEELGVSSSQWSVFGRITNKEPVRESRHRGKYTELRPATEEERDQANAFARTLIEKYLDYCDLAKEA